MSELINNNNVEKKLYSHPPITLDLLYAFKQWYGMHQHLPKLFRISISSKMIETLSECIELVVSINFGKKTGNDLRIVNEKLLELRGKIELLKAYSLVSWELKFISHGFYQQYSERLETISKQVSSWHSWFLQNYKVK